MDDEVQYPKAEDGSMAADGGGAMPASGAVPPSGPKGPVAGFATSTPNAASPAAATPAAATRKRGAGLVVGAVVVVLVLVAAVGIIVGVTAGSHSAAPSASNGTPGKAVLTAIDSTLGAKTADLHLTMLMTVPGKGQITATGDGSMDFGTDAAQLTLGYGGQQGLGNLQITERYVGGTIYMSMPQISTVVPGKSWIEVPVGGSSLAPGSSNPASMFQVLQANGDIVTPLGGSIVNGTAVEGYHVVVTQAAIDKRLSEANLPDGIRQAVQGAKGMFSNGGLLMDVFVSDTNHMLARMVMDLHMTIAGQPVTATVTEDTSNFGVPVSVTPPPADQVASYQEFTQAASGLANTAQGG